jgi:choline-sulfatase
MMSDQHSKHVLGCYGNPLVRTPHLDGLAAGGVRFTNAYCASPLCVPSRMAFMTSRTPSHNRVWSNSHILHSGIPTWAHALGAAGYETSLIGRMHFVGSDQRHGFERRPLGEYMATHPGVGWAGAAAFDKLKGTTGQSRGAVERAGRGRTSYTAFDEMVTETTRGYLEEYAHSSNDRPFVAVAGYMLPHCPFAVPRDLFDYYYERVDVPVLSDDQRARLPEAVRRFQRSRGIEEPLPEERIRVARAAYFGMCEFLDTQVGRVLETLRETGQEENTLVIYCSDHGEMAGEHGCWWKSNYYEGSVGVPLIARLPGDTPIKGVDRTICNLMDLGPTLVDLAGGDPMPAVDGRSLLPNLKGEFSAERLPETFSEHLGAMDGVPSRMIRRGPWKLYDYHAETSPVMYNLEDDPGEENDLGGDPNVASVRAELLEALYADWSPDGILEESRRLDEDLETIRAWGAAVGPKHLDTLPVPEDPEDVELM